MNASIDPRQHEIDRALAGAVGRRDEAAAEAFARRLLPGVRRIVVSLLGAGADADDVVQQTLLALLQSAQSYRGDGPLERWAQRSAVRGTLRWLQRRRTSLEQTTAEPEPHAIVDEDALAHGIPRSVEEYLARLPESQRTALVLRCALGHTLAEIAEMTEAPIPTVKSRLLKAQDNLRRWIRRDVALGVERRRIAP